MIKIKRTLLGEANVQKTLTLWISVTIWVLLIYHMIKIKRTLPGEANVQKTLTLWIGEMKQNEELHCRKRFSLRTATIFRISMQYAINVFVCVSLRERFSKKTMWRNYT